MFLETPEENFMQAREALSLFEKISRAKLNMEKSTLVPIDDFPQPDWLTTTGCKITQPGEVGDIWVAPLQCILQLPQNWSSFLAKLENVFAIGQTISLLYKGESCLTPDPK